MLEPVVVAMLVASDRPIVVTGAGGWIGLATLDMLERALGDDFNRRVIAYGSTARTLDLGGGRTVPQRSLADISKLDAPGAWVLHFAFLTKDRAEAMSEAEYRAANVAIGDTVCAALDRIDAAAVFVASSGAAAKADDPLASAAMRLYGAMKRDDEERFAAWAKTRGRRAVIARIFNISGPHINKHGAYAMANFILDVLAGRRIAVRAPRRVMRGYVAIRELMSLVFALMADRPDGIVRFDSGGEALELGEVARIVCDTLSGAGTDRATIIEPDDDIYAGDGAAYAMLLARHAITPVPLDGQIVETARYLSAVTG